MVKCGLFSLALWFVADANVAIADVSVGIEESTSCPAGTAGCESSVDEDEQSLLAINKRPNDEPSVRSEMRWHREHAKMARLTDEMLVPIFDVFLDIFDRPYVRGTPDYEIRYEIYENRRAMAREHNRKQNRRWTAGVNDHWDFSDNELQTLYGGRGNFAEMIADDRFPMDFDRGEVDDLPRSVMYTDLATSKHVLKQGLCGSCWAISSSSLLEAHYEIYTGHIRTFSAQELLNCVPNPELCGGFGGCKGATQELAMDWVWKHGLSTAERVPYEAVTGECTSHHKRKGHAAFGMIGWRRLPTNEYEPLLRALYERGPVGTSVACDTWHLYKFGIFDECPRDAVLNHAVLLEGYGIDEEIGEKFWQIKNSWGSSFGEDGKIRLLRSEEQRWCGTNDQPEHGSGCKGGPSPVRVCGSCGILYENTIPLFEGDGIAAREAAIAAR